MFADTLSYIYLARTRTRKIKILEISVISDPCIKKEHRGGLEFCLTSVKIGHIVIEEIPSQRTF